jgi:hypothetical protein
MITPEQLRNSARFGTPLRAETIMELADRLEALTAQQEPACEKCGMPLVLGCQVCSTPWPTKDSTPPSGVREGMLLAAANEALTALNMGLGQQDAEYDDAVKQAIKARDMLVDALRAEAEKLPQTHVMVPVETLRILRHYTESHRMVFPSCGAPTAQEVEAMLRAAQEGK